MNIAVFADIHGRIALSFKLCARWEKETGQKLDLILQAGDLGVFPDESRLDKATIRHAEKDPTEPGFLNDFLHERPEIAAILSQTSGNMIFVRGNHEDHHWLDGLEDRRQGALFPVDAYRQPAYHFFGHYGGPCRQGTDSNGKTLACKLADLDWDYTDRGKSSSLEQWGCCVGKTRANMLLRSSISPGSKNTMPLPGTIFKPEGALP